MATRDPVQKAVKAKGRRHHHLLLDLHRGLKKLMKARWIGDDFRLGRDTTQSRTLLLPFLVYHLRSSGLDEMAWLKKGPDPTDDNRLETRLDLGFTGFRKTLLTYAAGLVAVPARTYAGL